MRAVGGVQSVWLSSLARGPHCSGVSAADRRCLDSLVRRGLAVEQRPGAWFITDAGRAARYAPTIATPRRRR